MSDEPFQDYVKTGPSEWMPKHKVFKECLDPLAFRDPKPRGEREPFFSSPASLVVTVLTIAGLVLYYRWR